MTTITSVLTRPLLSDIVDPEKVSEEIAAGYIRERQHPLDPDLRILNYTEKAQYEKHWTKETLRCRGLIYNASTLQVSARPFTKFFNYGEYMEGTLDLEAPAVVTDKLDGSLGILYDAPDGWAIATRGSFESEQAIHATKVLRESWVIDVARMDTTTFTYLFEIIYPGNRIVIDYGPRDDLFLLGQVDKVTGRVSNPGAGWAEFVPQTTHVRAKNLREALALPPRNNAEGLVVRNVETGLMVKIKQEDYVRLHKLVTGLSVRAIWEHLSANDGDITGMLEAIPDEFHDWVRVHADDLEHKFDELYGIGWALHNEALQQLPDHFERREYAVLVAGHWQSPIAFTLLDDRNQVVDLWRGMGIKCLQVQPGDF